MPAAPPGRDAWHRAADRPAAAPTSATPHRHHRRVHRGAPAFLPALGRSRRGEGDRRPRADRACEVDSTRGGYLGGVQEYERFRIAATHVRAAHPEVLLTLTWAGPDEPI